MANHPFHGTWSSYVVKGNHTIAGPFDLMLNITPGGAFLDGKHKNIPLECKSISNTKIHLKELGGENATLKAEITLELGDIQRKALAGTAKYPMGGAPSADKPGKVLGGGQNDGVWVATQP